MTAKAWLTKLAVSRRMVPNSDHDPSVVVLLPQVVHPARQVDIQTESLSITKNQDGSLCAGLEVVGKAGRTTGHPQLGHCNHARVGWQLDVTEERSAEVSNRTKADIRA